LEGWVGQSDGFFVDPGALSDGRDQVGRLLGGLDEVARFGSGSPVVDFGHDAVADAVGSFYEQWGTGIDGLAADGERLHRKIGDTLETYRRVDEDIAASFDKIGNEEAGGAP
jgi:hypothetical protein